VSEHHEELEPLRSILDGLRAHEDFGDVDLVPQIRAAIAAPPPARLQRRALYAGGALALALAACAALWIGLPRRDRADDGFRVKGAAAGDADRWVGLSAYQAGSDGAFHRADRVSAARPLAFSYTNVGPHPYGYLIVLGIDATGARFRYYPAEDAPGSIAIRADTAVQLPDLVEHELHPGPLALYGVFSEHPLSVTDVEAALAAGRPVGDATVVRVDVQVEP
jgi:hypothetical protein